MPDSAGHWGTQVNKTLPPISRRIPTLWLLLCPPEGGPMPVRRPFSLPLVSQVPYDDLRYLFGEIMYGGHITDDWDRRLCRTYLEEFIKPEMLEGELTLAPGFPLPGNMDYNGYHEVRLALSPEHRNVATRWTRIILHCCPAWLRDAHSTRD